MSSLFTSLLAAGCGGGNAVHGSVDGQSMTARTAALTQGPIGDSIVQLNVALSPSSDACAVYTTQGAGFPQLLLGLREQSGGSAESAPSAGTYAVVQSYSGSGKEAGVHFEATLGGDTPATSGSVTLDQVQVGTGGTATGSFDLKFGSDAITGTFDASYCPGVAF